MALVHLQTTQISKYIHFDNSHLGIVHNESIVFQKCIRINKTDLKQFIIDIIGEEQFLYLQVNKPSDPPDFHGDKLEDGTLLSLKHEFSDKIVKSFTIGLNTYTFYGVGIDIHTGEEFTREKKGQQVTMSTKDSHGNINNGNIELKYRCPDLKYPTDQEKGRIIVLNFHIELNNKDDKFYDKDLNIYKSKSNFTAQLEQMYGNRESSFIKFIKKHEKYEEYIKKLEDMNISNFTSISNEPMVSLLTKYLPISEGNLEVFKNYINNYQDIKQFIIDLNTYKLLDFKYNCSDDYNGIELTYIPDLNHSTGPEKGRMIILIFHFDLNEKFRDINKSKNNFTTQFNYMLKKLNKQQIQIFKVAKESLKYYEELIYHKENLENESNSSPDEESISSSLPLSMDFMPSTDHEKQVIFTYGNLKKMLEEGKLSKELKDEDTIFKMNTKEFEKLKISYPKCPVQ